MLANDNNFMAFNNYKEMPQLPYKIITTLLTQESQSAEDFWKYKRGQKMSQQE